MTQVSPAPKDKQGVPTDDVLRRMLNTPPKPKKPDTPNNQRKKNQG